MGVDGIGYMRVACIGVVVGLWDFGDFCSVAVFVSGCLYGKAPAWTCGGACRWVICYQAGLAGCGTDMSL